MIISPSEAAILDEVGRWKVAWVNDLYRLLEVSTGYIGFCKKIRVLEKKGYLEGRNFKRLGKYVHLTEKGARRSSTGAMPGKNSLDHDLICSEVVLKLLEFGSFTSGNVPEGEDSDLCPDGIILGAKNGKPYTLALEVELSQKGRFRIEKKFIDYAGESAHTCALYITNKKSLFHNYRKILTSMNEEIQKSIILSLTEKLGDKLYDHRKAVYWLNGVEYSFDALFGERERNV